MKKLVISVILCLFAYAATPQASLIFQKTYGGTNHEYAHKTLPTSDGGFVFVGYSESSNGDLTVNKGGEDLWVAKANSAGVLEWSKSYGGTEDEQAWDIVEIPGGGYFVAGLTYSTDCDVIGHHGTYNNDFWVLKLSSTGTLMNQHCYGGSYDDDAVAIKWNASGGLYVAGTTDSHDGDVSGIHSTSYSDIWLIKIDTALALQSQLCIGGTDYEEGIDMIATLDGGCAIAGRTYSNDGDVSGYHDGSDMLIAKVSSAFAVEWAHCFGGSETEEGNSLVQLADGSFCALGYTSTHNNGDVTGHHGAQGMDDFWLVKLTSAGILEWAKCYGGSGDDQANGLTKAADGGYFMCGLTNSTDGDVSGFHTAMFDPDIWVAKTDASGTFQWQRCCGGSGQDESFRTYEESPGIFVVTGFTYSSDYDVTNWHGDADGWIIKVTGTSGFASYSQADYNIFPNPADSRICLDPPIHGVCRVYNTLGVLVSEPQEINSSCFDLPELDAGLYFMEIISGNQSCRISFQKR